MKNVAQAVIIAHLKLISVEDIKDFADVQTLATDAWGCPFVRISNIKNLSELLDFLEEAEWGLAKDCGVTEEEFFE